jgi:hypothetical protein
VSLPFHRPCNAFFFGHALPYCITRLSRYTTSLDGVLEPPMPKASSFLYFLFVLQIPHYRFHSYPSLGHQSPLLTCCDNAVRPSYRASLQHLYAASGKGVRQIIHVLTLIPAIIECTLPIGDIAVLLYCHFGRRSSMSPFSRALEHEDLLMAFLNKPSQHRIWIHRR